MTTPVAEAETARAPGASHRSALVAAGTIAATGLALGVAYFPMLFSRWNSYDDEGMFLVSLRELLKNHSLYDKIWADKYGPFYYMVMSTVYRIIHQQPTLENGRWIVLVVTVLSTGLFGAAAWRVTRSIPAAALCQVTAFLILIPGAGQEPMHPGSLGVLVLSVVAFELASYSANPRNLHLAIIGVAAGALVMTKLNAGGLVLLAVVAAFIVGNSTFPRQVRLSVAILASLGPIILVAQNLTLGWVATLLFVVLAAVAATFVVMSVDLLRVPKESLLWVAAGAAGSCAVSALFPLITGSSLSSVLTGVFIRPLDQSKQLIVASDIRVNWLTIVLTAGVAGAVVAFRAFSKQSTPSQRLWLHIALAGVGLWLLGVVPTLAPRLNPTAEWLPALALLPAIAYFARAPGQIRFVLRALVLLAALQILVAYPVAGSQVGWGTVAMTVPCAIAIAIGTHHITAWNEARRETKLLITACLCLALVFASTLWPPEIWKSYLALPKFGLPGTGLMRVDPSEQKEVQAVAELLPANCDAFYSVPDMNSFYIFTGMPAFTGMLVDRPDALTPKQQEQIAATLREKAAAHERVCILRDTAQVVVRTPGPLSKALRPYDKVIATVGGFTISKHN